MVQSELLFIHRDADHPDPTARRAEILAAVKQSIPAGNPPAVCVVPVRMTEAWLLFDEHALRVAAGNPGGRATLHMPGLRELEGLADPKARLRELLLEASETRGRRRRDFPYASAVHRLASLIATFAPLRALGAFRALEQDVRAILRA